MQSWVHDGLLREDVLSRPCCVCTLPGSSRCAHVQSPALGGDVLSQALTSRWFLSSCSVRTAPSRPVTARRRTCQLQVLRHVPPPAPQGAVQGPAAPAGGGRGHPRTSACRKWLAAPVGAPWAPGRPPPRGSPLQLRRHSPGRPGPWAGASGEGAAGTATAHPLAASLRVAPGGLTWSSGGSSCVPVASSVLFVWPHGTGGAVLSPERVSAGSSWEAAWARDAPRAFTLVPHGADGAELRSRASALQEELSPPTSEVAPARTVPRSSHVPFCSRDGRSVVMFTGLFLFW